MSKVEYVLPHNIDDRVLSKACAILGQGGIVCLPTDTNWILLANPYHKSAMDRLYKIKKENPQKHFSLLCSNISQASDVAIIDNNCFKILKKTIPGHYTFIFEATKKISKVIKATKTDKEIGIRFVPSNLVNALLESYEDVVISTNIPRTMFSDYDSEDIYSYMIEDCNISHLIDLIIDPGEFEFVGESTIVSFIGGHPEIKREGAGDSSLFI